MIISVGGPDYLGTHCIILGWPLKTSFYIAFSWQKKRSSPTIFFVINRVDTFFDSLQLSSDLE